MSTKYQRLELTLDVDMIENYPGNKDNGGTDVIDIFTIYDSQEANKLQ